uniref:Amino acid permease/ SLC12A domain-containing protein n=1 Tax=Parascaris equorum TaxID=6256 RepID=A0A914R6G1_PAREQ
GTAGIANAVLLLIICTTLALIPVFSAIGICERCQIQSGGIYFLISHVLGGQIGGAVGLMYAFGQLLDTESLQIFRLASTHYLFSWDDAHITCTMCTLKRGETKSIAKLFDTDDTKIVKLVAAATLLVLTAIFEVDAFH